MKLGSHLNKTHQKSRKLDFEQIKYNIIQVSRPLMDKWNQRTARERNLLITMFAVLGVFIIYVVINSMLNLITNIKSNNLKLQAINIQAHNINQEYNEINKIPPNQFSVATKTSITQDMQQILKVKTPNILLDSGVLTLSAQNVTFNDVTAFMEQLRNSYALFPQKLTITRSVTSGYITLNATFLVNNNAN